MLKYARYILGATLFYFATVNVVYGTLPKESPQNETNVLSSLYKEVKSDKKSEVLLAESKIEDSIYITQKDLSPVGSPSAVQNILEGSEDALAYSRPIVNQFFLGISEVTSMVAEGFQNFTKPTESLRNPIVVAMNKAKSEEPEGINKTICPQEIIYSCNMYIDIRTKLTYTETYLDTLKTLKKERDLKFDKIREQVRKDLKNNIMKFSDSNILKEQFKERVSKGNSLATHEERYLNFLGEEIEKAGKIEILETSVSQVMEQELMEQQKDGWVDHIASLVSQERKRNSSDRCTTQGRSR